MLKNVSADTLHLVTNLSDSDMDEILNTVDFNLKKGNSVYEQILLNREPLFLVYIKPRIQSALHWNGSYNIFIKLQKDAINTPPALIKYLLSFGVWKYKRIDIAYDFNVRTKITHLIGSGRAKCRGFKDNDNHYLYGKGSPFKGVVYDKKLQLKLKDIEIEDEQLTRLELRLRPQLQEQTSIYDFGWIEPYMSKFHFTTSTYKVSHQLNEKDKKVYQTVRRRVNKDWHGIEPNSKKRIRKTIKANSEDLYGLFKTRCTIPLLEDYDSIVKCPPYSRHT